MGNSSDMENLRTFADQLWKYMEPKINAKLSSNVSYFRAEVVSNPGGNKLEVQRPVENGTLTLPCTTAMSGATEGQQVTVLVMGSLSNAVVVADGKMDVSKFLYITAGQESGTTLGDAATAEGRNTVASGDTSHAEGMGTQATGWGYGAHAEGLNTRATGYFSHAEGINTLASGEEPGVSSIQNLGGSHAEGFGTIASGEQSHAEGKSTRTAGIAAHAEGSGSSAGGEASHAEGISTDAVGQASHAEGYTCQAIGNFSHAEGLHAVANGVRSHAEGYETIASGDDQHVFGRYNVSDTTSAEIVGWGASNARKNIRTLATNGNEWIAGTLTQASDARLKDVQGKIPDLSSIRAVRFRWKNGDDKEHLGYLAQDVEEIAPYLVGVDSNGYKSLDYIALLTAKVEMLEREIEKLKGR